MNSKTDFSNLRKEYINRLGLSDDEVELAIQILYDNELDVLDEMMARFCSKVIELRAKEKNLEYAKGEASKRRVIKTYWKGYKGGMFEAAVALADCSIEDFPEHFRYIRTD